MSNLPPDTRGLRQMIYVCLIAFVVGFFAVLATLGWLIARFVAPDGRWWDILHVSIGAILISVVFGGLSFAAISVWLLSRFHYWRGVYRCRFCDRPLKGAGIPCDCPEAQALRR
jgi:hypothetical protein